MSQHHQPCTTTYNSWQLKDCRAWSRCSLTYVKEQLLPRLLVQPNKIHSATSWWQSERASSFFPNSDLQFTGDCTRPPRLRTWSKLVVNFLGEIWRVWVHESACPLHEELYVLLGFYIFSNGDSTGWTSVTGDAKRPPTIFIHLACQNLPSGCLLEVRFGGCFWSWYSI